MNTCNNIIYLLLPELHENHPNVKWGWGGGERERNFCNPERNELMKICEVWYFFHYEFASFFFQYITKLCRAGILGSVF